MGIERSFTEDPSSAPRFPFSVDRIGDRAFIAMHMGGIHRVRHMRPDLLRQIGEVIRSLLDEAKGQVPDASEIPPYPDCHLAVTADIVGACRITFGCSRLAAGGVEWVVALYDEGDDSVPILVLIDEQIDEFVRQA